MHSALPALKLSQWPPCKLQKSIVKSAVRFAEGAEHVANDPGDGGTAPKAEGVASKTCGIVYVVR